MDRKKSKQTDGFRSVYSTWIVADRDVAKSMVRPNAEHKGTDRRIDGAKHDLAGAIAGERANNEFAPAITDSSAIPTILL